MAKEKGHVIVKVHIIPGGSRTPAIEKAWSKFWRKIISNANGNDKPIGMATSANSSAAGGSSPTGSPEAPLLAE